LRAYGVALDGDGNAFVASYTGQSLWSLPGVGVPVNAAPAAPLVTVPQNDSTTGLFPKFAGKAVQENGAVDAEKVKVLDDDGVVLATVPVRQTDGYFSWKRPDPWPPGDFLLQFVAVEGERESQPTTLTFSVAPGPDDPTVTIPGDDAQVGPKPKFVGSAPEATQVLVQNTDNTTIATLTVRGDGYFSWTRPEAWAAGPHTIQFVAKNNLGHSEPTKKTFIVHIPAPTITLPGNGSVTGSLPKFSGTAPANSTVDLYENNQKLGTANVN
ncbi:Ig-like domain-containing protein, partial [Streptomyces sp. MS2.AVA.5]